MASNEVIWVSEPDEFNTQFVWNGPGMGGVGYTRNDIHESMKKELESLRAVVKLYESVFGDVTK